MAGACSCRAGNGVWTVFKFFHYLILNFKFSACLARFAEEYCPDFCLHRARAKQQHLSPAGNHLYDEVVDGSVSRPVPEYQWWEQRNKSQAILVTGRILRGLGMAEWNFSKRTFLPQQLNKTPQSGGFCCDKIAAKCKGAFCSWVGSFL